MTFISFRNRPSNVISIDFYTDLFFDSFVLLLPSIDRNYLRFISDLDTSAKCPELLASAWSLEPEPPHAANSQQQR